MLQVLPADAVDPTLTHVVDTVAERVRYAAYQYPDYLLEARDGARDGSICPSAYHINVLDIARDLRANNILTSVRRSGQSSPDRSTLDRVVTRMKRTGAPMEGVATLMMEDEADAAATPVAVLHGREAGIGRRPVDDLHALCDTLRKRFFAELSVQAASGDDYSSE